jgi:hypothetical protein
MKPDDPAATTPAARPATTQEPELLDPHLMQCFADHRLRGDLCGVPASEFVREVMRGVHTQRRRMLFMRIAVGLILALLAVPLQDPLELLTEYLLMPLIDADSPIGRMVFSPISSVGAFLSIGLLALRYLCKRLFG